MPEMLECGATRWNLGEISKDFISEPLAPSLFQQIAVNQPNAVNGTAAHAIVANRRLTNHCTPTVKDLPRLKIDFVEFLRCHRNHPGMFKYITPRSATK